MNKDKKLIDGKAYFSEAWLQQRLQEVAGYIESTLPYAEPLEILRPFYDPVLGDTVDGAPVIGLIPEGQNIMIDLETLSLSPNAAVVEIAIVKFDESFHETVGHWMVHKSHYYEHDPTNIFSHCFHEDPDTWEWHVQQFKKRNYRPSWAVDKCKTTQDKLGTMDLATVADEVYSNLQKLNESHEHLWMWANHPEADMIWLENFLRSAIGDVYRRPWHFRKVFNYSQDSQRFGKLLGIEPKPSASHCAEQDCIDQIEHLQRCHRAFIQYQTKVSK